MIIVARPKKMGLDYFPMDVDYYDDFKIMDLLNEYGPLGTTIYEVIISRVYKNGYYLEVPLDKLATQIVRIIGNRWIKDKNLVLQIIQYCADIGLFDNALLTQSVITSVGIQRRYSEVTVRNKVDKSKYWLLEKDNVQVALVNAPKNEVSVTETGVFVTETSVNATSIPQKESKVKKSKVNESKVNESSAISIILSDNSSYDIDQGMLDYYKTTYNNINVVQSLRRLSDYMSRNKSKRRNINNIENYIRLWLEQDNSKAKAKEEKPIEQEQKQYIKGVDYF